MKSRTSMLPFLCAVGAVFLGSGAFVRGQNVYPFPAADPVSWTCSSDSSCEPIAIKCKSRQAYDLVPCPIGSPCSFCEHPITQTQCKAGEGVGCEQADGDIPNPWNDCGWVISGMCDGYACSVNLTPSTTTRCSRIWCRQAVCP